MASNQLSVQAVFFDIRDTLGLVDRKGHLVTFKPSTEDLLEAMKSMLGVRIGVISNLPSDVDSAHGRAMLEDAGLLPFVDPKGIVFNHDAKSDKPEAAIYRYAAAQVGVPIEQCLFVGENLVEVLGAQAAGMKAQLKPCPPGREFTEKPIRAKPATELFSGRVFEQLFEEDHLLGKRIVRCAAAIAEGAQKSVDSARLLPAMGILVYLLVNFIDAYHHRKEEEVLLPLALARGMPPEKCAFVPLEHAQGRAYFTAMSVALTRVRAGDTAALSDFARAAGGTVGLYKEHGRKEDDLLFPAMGAYITDTDDSLIVDLMAQVGPRDLTPYLGLIQALEQSLGLEPV
jgi:hemerythrin-like domain-containing protein